MSLFLCISLYVIPLYMSYLSGYVLPQVGLKSMVMDEIYKVTCTTGDKYDMI